MPSMKQRNVALVILYSLLTFGIYILFWLNSTRKELIARGATHIPGIWMLVVPVIFVIGALIVFLTTAIRGFNSPELNTMIWFTSIGLYMFFVIVWITVWIYWIYKYSQAVDYVTKGQTAFTLSFWLGTALLILGYFPVWPGIIQDGFNKLADTPRDQPHGRQAKLS